MKELKNIPEHVAIILDGNGRWAKKRGLPRSIGHYQGGMNLVKVANAANEFGIKILTVYAFSTENWNRPEDEVTYLMTKPVEILNKNLEKFEKSTIKIVIRGRKDRIPKALLETFNKIEEVTKEHNGLLLNICFDYGSYYELLEAFKNVKEFSEAEVNKHLLIKNKVDLLIRTGGEMRLSNFLLWQASYAELYFVKKYWPQFGKKDLLKAIKDYAKRNRRFGGIKA